MAELNILIVEDSEDDTLLIVRELNKHHYKVSYKRVETASALTASIDESPWDLVITDHNMPGFNSVDVLNIVRGAGKDIPVIIVSGAIGENLAVEVMRAGANDYVMKDNLIRLVPAIERELRDVQMRREKVRVEETLSTLSQYDILTGLINRPMLLEVLKNALTRMHTREKSLAVLYIDLDRFKVINDTYGLEVGDQVLSEVAKRLKHCARYDDTLARYGSDEFILIVEEIGDEIEASVLADMIITQLSHPIHIDDMDIRIRASVGIVVSGPGDELASELIQNADAAMYQAKSQGRNSYQIYSPEMNQAAEHRRYLELSLHRAMELNELEIYFQPQMDLKRNRLRGAEVLLRWQHGTLGLVSPDEFIELMEETGLIASVGEWVMRSACSLWCEWIEKGYLHNSAVLSINISSYQFSGDLVDTVKTVMEETGIRPELVDLEITESTLMENTTESQHALAQLKNLGLNLSIDDFGTGYSSLSYLTRFPIHALKIDKSFVADITSNKGNALIAKTIIGLANSLELSVIAEGVESQEAVNVLLAQGCHIHQGFYFAKPLPVSEFLPEIERLLAENQPLTI